jgi:hypothetical protein
LGEAECEGLGPLEPLAPETARWAFFGEGDTGVKAFALALGLNDEALTFSLLAALLGDMGGAPFPDGLARLLPLLCLKGGIGARGGMGILVGPFATGGATAAAAGGAAAGAAFAC